MRRFASAALAMVMAILVSIQSAPAAPVSVTGRIVADDARPIAGATVLVRRPGAPATTTTRSDRRGRFRIDGAQTGDVLTVRAPGYGASAPLTLSANSLQPIEIRLRGAHAPIGAVSTRADDGVLPRGADDTASVSAADGRADGALRTGDVLVKLPSLSAIGQGSSVSDDLFLSLRGFKPSETLTLLDGHPIGPLGVSPDMTAGFDYQNAPLFALRGATVTYGAGPSARYAFDAPAGIIDLETLQPTDASSIDLAQGVGSQARLSTYASATGRAGALRYAFAYGVQGTSGNFVPQTVTQSGLRGSDFTSATLQALTYPVSANTVLRNGLATVQESIGRATSITLTSDTATSWIDKTGVDDNDDYPYAFEFEAAEANRGSALIPGGAHCPPSLVPVIDDAHLNAAQPDCITPQAFAAGASGPAGGGPGAYQTMREDDDALHVMTQAGAHAFLVDIFGDAQTTSLVRPASFVQDEADTTTTHLTTNGFDARDEIAIGATTIDAGVSSVRQLVQTDNVPSALGEANAFLDAHGSLGATLDASANVLAKRFTALGATVLDPRVSLVYRPSPNDALRVFAGAASAEPAASARGGTTTLSSAGDLDPGNCTTFVVGSAPNPVVTSERATDVELAYSRRFGIAGIGATGYVTSVSNAIFGAGMPLAAIPGYGVDSPGLASFYDRVRSVCPAAYAGASDAQIFNALNVTQAVNAAHALARGVELSGDLRIAPRLTLAATYTITSNRRFDLPAAVLAVPSNVTIVDGGQVAGVPIHQGSLTLAGASARGLSFEFAAYYVGPNNNLNLPGYAYANVALHAPLARGLRLDLAVNDAFDSHADIYGRVGLGLFQPENPFGADGSALEQATERYGLAPASIVLTLTQHVGRR